MGQTCSRWPSVCSRCDHSPQDFLEYAVRTHPRATILDVHHHRKAGRTHGMKAGGPGISAMGDGSVRGNRPDVFTPPRRGWLCTGRRQGLLRPGVRGLANVPRRQEEATIESPGYARRVHLHRDRITFARAALATVRAWPRSRGGVGAGQNVLHLVDRDGVRHRALIGSDRECHPHHLAGRIAERPSRVARMQRAR